jgi:uncharacterized Fe-S center protein
MGSKVYFASVQDADDPSRTANRLKKLYDVSGAGEWIKKDEFIAVKTHFGEHNNKTFLNPIFAKAVCDKVKQKGAFPFLVETSTLYRGERSNAIDHLMLANEHGFGFERMHAPIIMADGLFGDAEITVGIEGKHFKEVKIAREIVKAQGLLALSHFTGHMAGGFGAAIKNVGMGLASRRGKLKQHSVMSPEVNRGSCTACGECIKWCPEDTISLVDGKAYIDKKGCIGCGECLAVCRFGAVMFDWKRESRVLQEMMAEYVAGILTILKNKAFYLNFLVNITKDCDCASSGRKVSEDIGIVAGSDVVAVEKASYDIFHKSCGKYIQMLTYPRINPLFQVEHAEKMGLGTTDYEIIEVGG